MKHKNNDYKLNYADYYLTKNKSQEKVCKIVKYFQKMLMKDQNNI
jgi:hypothetical protein